MGKLKVESFFLPSSKNKHGYFKINLSNERVVARIYYLRKKDSKNRREEYLLKKEQTEELEESEILFFDLDEFCRAVSALSKIKKATICSSDGNRRLELFLEEKKNGDQIRLEFHLKKQIINFWISRKKFFSFIPSPRFIIIFQIPSALESICKLNQLIYTWFERVWTRNYYRALRRAEEIKKEWEKEVQDYLYYVILPVKILHLPRLIEMNEK